MDWSGLVGIPFKDKGREVIGCDCWGLARLAYLRGKGIDLGIYGESYSDVDDAGAIDRLIGEGRSVWRRIAPGAEQPFDLVLMIIHRRQHIGIVTRRGQMLHLPRDSFSVIERTDRYRGMIEGFYRHASADRD